MRRIGVLMHPPHRNGSQSARCDPRPSPVAAVPAEMPACAPVLPDHSRAGAPRLRISGGGFLWPLARATSLISASFAFRLISCICDRMLALGEKLRSEERRVGHECRWWGSM